MFGYHSRPDNAPGEELELLLETAKRLSENSNPNDLLKEVVTFVASLAKCGSTRVYLIEKHKLVLYSLNGPGEEELHRFPMNSDDDSASWLMQMREPITIPARAYDDIRTKVFSTSDETSFESAILVPIIGGGKFLGVINVRNLDRQSYSRSEIDTLATIGFLLGTKLESARLKRENNVLSEKIETRSVVEQAKQIVQHDLGISEQAAYRMIQLESQHRNKRMYEIAEGILLNHERNQISRVRGSNSNLDSKPAYPNPGKEFKSPQSKS